MSDALKVLNYEGPIGIQDAKEIKLKLLSLIDGQFNIIVNLSRLEAIDLSCLQVILSAKFYAKRKGLTLQFSNTFSPEAVQAFFVCGLIPSVDLSGREINRYLNDIESGE